MPITGWCSMSDPVTARLQHACNESMWKALFCTMMTSSAAASCLQRTSRIAIVGGGITGSCAAAELSRHFESVQVLDQGRRGPGGRASHRSVEAESQKTLADDTIFLPNKEIFEFDHGCQFFRADSDAMKDLVADWEEKGWIAPWNARLGRLPRSSKSQNDFFGVPVRPQSVYVGVGGMHLVPRHLLASSPAIQVHQGTRVSRVQRNEQGEWELLGVRGSAAFHDTSEADAQLASEQILTTADIVLFTDISSASDSWHRASAGIPDELRRNIPEKVRLPLFSCMVALDRPVANHLQLDAFCTDAPSPLWFACRSQSKPGFAQGNHECWTLISTPAYAVDQIQETNMRDPQTGSFRPQHDDYLNSIPGPTLWKAFLHSLKEAGVKEVPKAVYLQAQRWGSGLPVSPDIALNVQDIVGTKYASNTKGSLVYEASTNRVGLDFVAEDSLGLYYAGDFCSNRNPGFEAAALSGLDAAKHLVGRLMKK